MASIDLAIVLRMIDRTRGGVSSALRRLKSLSEAAGEASKKGFKLAADMNQAGEAIDRVGRIGRRAIGETVSQAANFGEAMAEVSTLVDTSVVNMDDLSEKTLELTRQFGGDAVGQAKALYQGISAGAKAGAESTALLTAANEFALGGVTDVETGVDALTSVLNAYGLSMTEAGDVSDSFFVAIKAGKTTAEELAKEMGKVAPIAKKGGVSIDEMNAALAAITKTGLKTDMAATGLRAALTGIIKPPKAVGKAAKDMGIDFSIASLHSKGLAKFMAEVVEKSGMTKSQLRKLAAESKRTGTPIAELAEKYGAQTENLAKLFPNVRALNAVLALSVNEGESFNNTMDAMNAKSGASAVAADKMRGTFAFQAREMKALGQTALIELGQTFIPLLREIMPDLRALLQQVRLWIKDNPELAKTLGKVAIAATAILSVFGPMIFAASSFVSLLSGGAGMVAMVGKLSGVLGSATLGIGKGFGPAIAKAGASVGKTSPLLGKLITKLGPAGLVAAAGAAGFAIGSWIDKATGASDAAARWLAQLTGLDQKLKAMDEAQGGRTDVRGAGFLSEEEGAKKAGLTIEEFRRFKGFGKAATAENIQAFKQGKLEGNVNTNIKVTVEDGRASARVESVSSDVGEVNVDGGVAMAGA